MVRKRTISSRISDSLDSPERRIFDNLGTPSRIQDYLDDLPINFELSGETYRSPREVLRTGMAHCFEGAVLAAAILAYHGKRPLLMDFQTTDDDVDHVVALFTEHGHWGAISKTNHATLRWRDPVYANPRELAMSYFHEYFSPDGSKSLLAFSKPFDLTRFAPARWVTTSDDLGWLAGELDHSRHVPVISRAAIKKLRMASDVERDGSFHIEWLSQGQRAARGTRDPRYK
jgi:hypothetical protein